MPSLCSRSSLSALPDLADAAASGALILMPERELAPVLNDTDVRVLFGVPWALLPHDSIATLDGAALSADRLLFTTPVFVLEASPPSARYIWRYAASGRRGVPVIQPFHQPLGYEHWFSYPTGHLTAEGIVVDTDLEPGSAAEQVSRDILRLGYQAVTLWSDILHDALARGIAQRTN